MTSRNVCVLTVETTEQHEVGKYDWEDHFHDTGVEVVLGGGVRHADNARSVLSEYMDKKIDRLKSVAKTMTTETVLDEDFVKVVAVTDGSSRWRTIIKIKAHMHVPYVEHD